MEGRFWAQQGNSAGLKLQRAAAPEDGLVCIFTQEARSVLCDMNFKSGQLSVQ